jgi:hypothetical protein
VALAVLRPGTFSREATDGEPSPQGEPSLPARLTPTLLELHRADPAAVRRRIEDDARKARTRALWAFLRGFF